MGGGADDPSFSSFGSRWGIKGSSEVSEGLTGVYKFETRINANATSTNAKGGIDDSQSTNQLYVGLSGGFGSLTLGKQSGAAYNHSGAIRDISNWHSYGDVGSRLSNALSYSFSAEAFSMQVAAIMDGATDTDGAVDQVEFGMTVGLGDIGKVAIGYEKVEDSMMDDDDVTIHGPADSLSFDKEIKGLDKLFLRNAKKNVVSTKAIGLDGDHMIIEVVTNSEEVPTDGAMFKDVGGTYYLDDTACISATNVVADGCKGESAIEHTVVVMVDTAIDGADEKDNGGVTTYTLAAAKGASDADLRMLLEGTGVATTYGHKASHISASFGLAGITVALGHTTKDSNSPMMNDKMKTNFLGASGSIGDTGLSWNAWGRNVKNNDHKNGDDRSPWTVGLAKSLGGGATTFIEHTNADDGEDGTTSVALRVDF